MSARPIRAIVVAYHGPAQLERCLHSLAAVRTLIVDNSSSVEIAAVAAKYQATYVDPAANLGFAAAVNHGLRIVLEGKPCDVLLINPDAALTPGSLERLSQCLHRSDRARVAAVAPRLWGDDGSEQRVVWPFPTPWRAWVEAAGLGRFPFRRSFVIGAVLLLDWEAIGEVGLFDERFFLYAEETDWQRRALRLGWSARRCCEARAHHLGAGASSDLARREALFHSAQETYVRKWFGAAGWEIYRSAVIVGALLRAALLKDERRAEARRRARIYRLGPRKFAHTDHAVTPS